MDLTKKKKVLLEKLYTDPESSAAFTGIQRLYEEAKKINPKITRKDVIFYLQGNRIYTMHKPRRLKFKKAKFIPAGCMTDLQVFSFLKIKIL